MAKRCTGCEETFPEVEFRWKNKKKGLRISRCRECDRQYRASRHAQNRDRILASQRQATERRGQKVARGALTEPDVLRCIDCAEVKPPDQFPWKSKSLLRRKPRCRSCGAAYRSDHYHANKADYLENNQRNYHKLRQIIREHKNVPCGDCGRSFPPVAMDFDHRNPAEKVMKVSALVYKGSEKLLRAEIAKCDVLCAVCHRIRHYTPG